MKVKELVKVLKKLDQENEILISADEEGNAYGLLDKNCIDIIEMGNEKYSYIIFPYDTILPE